MHDAKVNSLIVINNVETVVGVLEIFDLDSAEVQA